MPHPADTALKTVWRRRRQQLDSGILDPPPLPQAIWETHSPKAQAAVAALVHIFERRIAALE